MVPPQRHRCTPRTCKPRRCGDGPWSGAREDISQPQAPQAGDRPNNCAGLTHPQKPDRPRTDRGWPKSGNEVPMEVRLRTPGPAPAGQTLGPRRSQQAEQHEPQGERPRHHRSKHQGLRLHPGHRHVQNPDHDQENGGNRQYHPEEKANPASPRKTLQKDHPQPTPGRLTGGYQTGPL